MELKQLDRKIPSGYTAYTAPYKFSSAGYASAQEVAQVSSVIYYPICHLLTDHFAAIQVMCMEALFTYETH